MKNYEQLIFRQFSDIYWYVTASINQVWLSLKKNLAKMHKYIKYQYLLLKDLFWSCTHAIVIFACTKEAIQITWHSVHWSAIWEGNSLILPFKHSQSKTKQKNNHPNQTKKVKKQINNYRYIHLVDLYHITNESVRRVMMTLSSNYGNKTVGMIPVKWIHLIVRARRMNLLINSMKDSGGDEITTRS